MGEAFNEMLENMIGDTGLMKVLIETVNSSDFQKRKMGVEDIHHWLKNFASYVPRQDDFASMVATSAVMVSSCPSSESNTGEFKSKLSQRMKSCAALCPVSSDKKFEETHFYKAYATTCSYFDVLMAERKQTQGATKNGWSIGILLAGYAQYRAFAVSLKHVKASGKVKDTGATCYTNFPRLNFKFCPFTSTVSDFIKMCPSVASPLAREFSACYLHVIRTYLISESCYVAIQGSKELCALANDGNFNSRMNIHASVFQTASLNPEKEWKKMLYDRSPDFMDPLTYSQISTVSSERKSVFCSVPMVKGKEIKDKSTDDDKKDEKDIFNVL
jgi:hypothetical protein